MFNTQDKLTLEEQQMLLRMARLAMECGVRREKLPAVEEAGLSSPLREKGASFVTLTIHGELRGCIGTLEARQPLAQDVCEHAVAAALQDPSPCASMTSATKSVFSPTGMEFTTRQLK